MSAAAGPSSTLQARLIPTGLVMSGEELEHRQGCEDGYPDHWPATINRIQNAEVWLRNYNEMVDANHWHQAMMGMAAQQAVENALKGVLSVHNAATGYSHQLLDTWQKLQELEQFSLSATEELLAAGKCSIRISEISRPQPPRSVP